MPEPHIPYEVPGNLRYVRLNALDDHGVKALAIRCQRCMKVRTVLIHNLKRDLNVSFFLRLEEFASHLRCRTCHCAFVQVIALYDLPPDDNEAFLPRRKAS